MRGGKSGILTKGKALYLAYDQGLEHGPSEFNEENANPEYVINLANKGKFNAIILQKGIAEKYRQLIKTPLILKLNGKTNLYQGEPISRQIATVDEALRLKAFAVGYTIYIGSAHEEIMLKEFSALQQEAHKKGLFVIAWIYPRGSSVKKEDRYMSYAARVGLELGADMVKLKYNGRLPELAWAVQCAGRTNIVVAGGAKKTEKQLLQEVRDVHKAGAAGLAIGRNIWQHENPLELTRKIKDILF